MRNCLILTLLLITQSVSLAENTDEFDSWIIQGAKVQERSTPATGTSADKTRVQQLSAGMAQFLSDKPFHEVVAFYIHKSKFTPPNWSILGRQFPGTNLHFPAHFSHTNMYRKGTSVSILHNIREEIATVNFLITDHPILGFLSVTIQEDSTTIRL